MELCPKVNEVEGVEAKVGVDVVEHGGEEGGGIWWKGRDLGVGLEGGMGWPWFWVWEGRCRRWDLEVPRGGGGCGLGGVGVFEQSMG